MTAALGPVGRTSPDSGEDDTDDGNRRVNENDVVDDQKIDITVDDDDLSEGEENWDDEVGRRHP